MVKVSQTKHMTKKGVVKKNPLGRKISADRYDYYLNVLPPLMMGKNDIIMFLKKLDGNDEMIKKLQNPTITGAFMQGEGWDRHDIYVRTKDDNHYRIGKTKHEWNTEMFRYNDWSKMTEQELSRYNGRPVHFLGNSNMIKLGDKMVSENELRTYSHTIAGFHDKVGKYLGMGMKEKEAVKRAEDEIIEKIKVCYNG